MDNQNSQNPQVSQPAQQAATSSPPAQVVTNPIQPAAPSENHAQQSQPTVSSVTSLPQTQTTPLSPLTGGEQIPQGTVHPEAEPLPPSGINEWAKLSEPEVALPTEVIEAGVESVPVTPVITPSQQAVGVIPAKETTPIPSEPSENFHFPFTLSQTVEIMHKDRDIKDSLRWLATLIFREIGIARKKKQQVQTTV